MTRSVRKHPWVIYLLLFLMWSSTYGNVKPNRDQARPNFIVLLADDFGFGDLNCYGNTRQEKGFIDAMADNGLLFQRWYAAESVCTPSRAALQTGRLPIRSGMIPGSLSENRVLEIIDSTALPRNELTIAELLKPMGYTSGFIGKWHLGINEYNATDGAHLPSNRGYDYVGHILPWTNHWTCDTTGRHLKTPDPLNCFIYYNTTIMQQPINFSQGVTQKFVTDGIDFIQKHQNSSFFLMLSFTHMHTSMFNSEEFNNSSKRGIYGDGIREMDWAAGQIVEAVHQLNLASNTLVLFLSDHGPHIELCGEGGVAGVLRGGKGYSSWEGGVRVPAIAYWPGVIPKQTTTSLPFSTMDILPTFLDLAGGTIPPNLDGISFASFLRNDINTNDLNDRPIFHYCSDQLMAVTLGNYKLKYMSEVLPSEEDIKANCPNEIPTKEWYQTWNCHGNGVTTLYPPLLYNIITDPSELLPINDIIILERIQARTTVHKSTLIPGVSQMDHGNPILQPCCGGWIINKSGTKSCRGCL